MRKYVRVCHKNKNVPDFIKKNGARTAEVTFGFTFEIFVKNGRDYELKLKKDDRYETRRISGEMLNQSLYKDKLYIQCVEDMVESFKEWS